MNGSYLTHLAGGFDAFPDAEIAENPGRQQTEHQIPVQRSHLLNPRRDPQNSASTDTEMTHQLQPSNHVPLVSWRSFRIMWHGCRVLSGQQV